MTDLRGRSMIEIVDSGIESANAAESRGEGNLTHRQASFIDELLDEMETAGLGDRERSRSQMSQEQAAKMARPDTYSFCKTFHSFVTEAAFTDETQSSRNRVRSSQPGWSSGRAFRRSE